MQDNTFDIKQAVKKALGFGDNSYQDDTIEQHIEIVKNDLFMSGVLPVIIESELSVGAITRGVVDTWDYSSNGKYSDIYNQSVIKLREFTLEDLETLRGE